MTAPNSNSSSFCKSDSFHLDVSANASASLFQSISDLSANYMNEFMNCHGSPVPCSPPVPSQRCSPIVPSQRCSPNLPSKQCSPLQSTSKLSTNVCGELCEVEAAILRADRPLSSLETEEITVFGMRGIWTNRADVASWVGEMPINQYELNEDPNPEFITKKYKESLEYVQELAVRYLKPPTPPAPGEIIIKQEPNRPTAPAPPLVIRQQPPRPCTPEPLVIREAPPPQPPVQCRKVITISGKRLPAPPRKVVVERLPKLPRKPQAVIVERWMPYTEQKRRIIYQRPPPDPVVCKPRNIIVQWESPEVVIKQEVKYLGVVCADPCDYMKRYGESLKRVEDMPDLAKNIPVQEGHILAADVANAGFELEGDIDALKLIDLDKEGLSIYKKYLNSSNESSVSVLTSGQHLDSCSSFPSGSVTVSSLISSPCPPTASDSVASAHVASSSPVFLKPGSSRPSAATLASVSASASAAPASASASAALASASASAAPASASVSAAPASASVSAAPASASVSAAPSKHASPRQSAVASAYASLTVSASASTAPVSVTVSATASSAPASASASAAPVSVSAAPVSSKPASRRQSNHSGSVSASASAGVSSASVSTKTSPTPRQSPVVSARPSGSGFPSGSAVSSPTGKSVLSSSVVSSSVAPIQNSSAQASRPVSAITSSSSASSPINSEGN